MTERSGTLVALVTGGTGGIGMATARKLGERGVLVVLGDLHPEGGERAERSLAVLRSHGIQCRYVRCDVCSYDDVERTVARIEEEVGPISILVNNAGIPQATKPLWELTLDEWDTVVRTNMDSLFYTMKALLPRMMARDYGRIVNMSSISGKEGNAREGAYCATKHGVLGLTKSAAKDVLQYDIRINAVCPALIDTPLLEGLPQSQIDYFTAKIPLGRLGRAEEVADMVSFLAHSEAVNFITGMTFDVSGGRADY